MQGSDLSNLTSDRISSVEAESISTSEANISKESDAASDQATTSEQRGNLVLQEAFQLRAFGYEEDRIRKILVAKYCNDLDISEKERKLRALAITHFAKQACAKSQKGASGSIKSDTLRELAELSGESFIKPVDPELAAQIAQEERGIINSMEGAGEEDIHDAVQAMKQAVIKGYLLKHGALVHAEGNRFFYLNRKESKLYDLEQPLWAAWLYCLCHGIVEQKNQEEATKEFIIACRMLPSTPVYRFSYWDEARKLLFVSRFDGSVYRLDGSTREILPNGQDVLFDDPIDWIPYNPTNAGSEQSSVFDDLIYKFPQWDGHEAEQSLGLYAWIISLFFPELCPAKPIVLFLGDKGSGKSTLLRLIDKYLFGINAEISGVPDKPDGFVVLASHSHILTLDNLDDEKPWLQDKLARLATGATEPLRKLYTTNEFQLVRYRSYAAITARTPDTLKRDDLVERTITFSLRRINEGAEASPAFKIEREMFKHVEEFRGAFWETLLTKLSATVKAIRERGLPQESMFRLADWETLGKLVSRLENKEDTWSTTLECFSQSQRRLLIEDEPMLEALRAAISKGKIKLDGETTYTSNDLYRILTRMFEEDDQKPADSSFASVRSFSKKLAMLYPMLRAELGVQKRRGTTKADLNRNLYCFQLGAYFEARKTQNLPIEPRKEAS